MSHLVNPPILTETPFKYGSPAIWLDAKDTSTVQLTSGRVSQWTDKSGNNNHFIQTNAAKRPLLSESGIFFEANGAYHLENSSYSRNTNSLCAFMAVKEAGRGTGTNIYGRWLSFFLQGGLDYNNLNSIILTNNTPNSGDIEVYRNSGTQAWIPKLTLNEMTIIGFELSGTSVKIWKNASSATGTTSSTAINTNRVRIGADTVEADSNIHGRVYEVVVFNSPPASPNITNIQLYLERKWIGDTMVFPT